MHAQEFFGGPVDERREVWRLGSPLVHVGAHAPPALLMYGAEEWVAPLEQSLDFVEAYARLGLDVGVRPAGWGTPRVLASRRMG